MAILKVYHTSYGVSSRLLCRRSSQDWARTEILYELAETCCIERIEDIIQSFAPVRVFDNVSTDA
jgi:hypothetical protein